ncbi:rCG28740, isoform CRA_a [Rattus norvegicus]|uniref:RCG28740, isoform CRA_a n=1 Tax=Rattus norvegicus TaxID=10116 RepID=A6HVR2_RAT|nr:rCG28740, isoform CRA_a [Rattus norvegicus]
MSAVTCLLCSYLYEFARTQTCGTVSRNDDGLSEYKMKSYEHMAKIRIAREAPSECNCPAGKMDLI